MNHRVQVFMSGCLTLKFSGSWKTVTGAASTGGMEGSAAFPLLLPPSGEIGMVSSGTGSCGLAVAIVNSGGGVVFKKGKVWMEENKKAVDVARTTFEQSPGVLKGERKEAKVRVRISGRSCRQICLREWLFPAANVGMMQRRARLP